MPDDALDLQIESLYDRVARLDPRGLTGAQLAAEGRWLNVLDRAAARKRREQAVTEPPAFDPRALLERLHAAGVQFVLIGGVALRLWGNPRLTGDVDICYARTRDNCRRLAAVLGQLHARRRDWPADLPDVLDAEALRAASTLTLETRLGVFDLLAVPDGTTGFDELLADAETFDLDGLPVLTASRAALLRMKRAAGRPKDLDDARWLESDLP